MYMILYIYIYSEVDSGLSGVYYCFYYKQHLVLLLLFVSISSIIIAHYKIVTRYYKH